MSGSRRARLLACRRALFTEPMGFVWGAATNAVTTTISYVVGPHAQLDHLMILHLAGVVLISTRFGRAVSTFTAITSVVAFDYFCIPPILAFALPDRHSVVTFVGMLVAALTMCTLIQRLRHQRAVARASEARTVALCELSLDLSGVGKASDLPRIAERHLEHLFGVGAMVLLSGPTGELDLARLSSAERVLAEASLERGRRAPDAWGSDGIAYHRIGTRPQAVGLIRVAVGANAPRGATEGRMLVAACADRIGVSLERLALSDAARRAQVEAEGERLRNALLSAVSHDLRTPLASILAAGTTLIRHEGDTATRRELLETIVQETERLNALVTNLLTVTRLEADTVRVNRTPEALDDLVYGVLSRLSGRLQGREVTVNVAEDLPLVAMDPVLVDQVIVNLIENVLVYTPLASPLSIEVVRRGTEVILEIEDRGPGISEEEREKVFEKFYRGAQGRLKHGGTGLGLAICRAVARVHGGRILANPRLGGGTSIEFALPCPDHGVERTLGWEPAQGLVQG